MIKAHIHPQIVQPLKTQLSPLVHSPRTPAALLSLPSWRPSSTRAYKPTIHTRYNRAFQTSSLAQASYRRFDEEKRQVWAIPSASNQNDGHNAFNAPIYGVPGWVWILGAGGGVYYISHLEKVELTGRWRFMDTSVEAELSTGELVYAQTLAQYRSKLLPPTHPTTLYVRRVAQQVIQASGLSKRQELGGARLEEQPFGGPEPVQDNGMNVTDWKIHVIDEPRIKNAFVIPGGKIFVFTGILPICKTEAGLAAVLGHEVAHQVLRHPAERMSSMKIVFLCTSLLAVLGLDPGICRALVTLLMTLPNSRRSEVEADQIGLDIMASACYDPREAVKLWKRMDEQQTRSSQLTKRATEFFQTHPAHDRRIEKIKEWIPKAQMKMEEKCGYTSQLYQKFFLQS